MTESKLFLPVKLATLLPGLPDRDISAECVLGSFLKMTDTEKYDFSTVDQAKFNGIYRKLKKLPNTTHAIFIDEFNKYLASEFERLFVKFNHPKEVPKTLPDFTAAYKEIKITDLDLTRYFDTVMEADTSSEDKFPEKESGLERLNYVLTKFDDDGNSVYSCDLALMSSEDTLKRTNTHIRALTASPYVNLYFVSNICGYLLRLSGVLTKDKFEEFLKKDIAEINGKGSSALISSAVVSSFIVNNFRELGKSFF